MRDRRWNGHCPDDSSVPTPDAASLYPTFHSIVNLPLFEEIDWHRPWLEPFLTIAQTIISRTDWRAALNARAATACLANHLGLPLQFVGQSDLPVDMAYEWFISTTGRIPTRHNLHDFFNAMVWLNYPSAKAQLNQIQAAEIARMTKVKDREVQQNSVEKKVSTEADRTRNKSLGMRGKVRDRATIFDENAAVLFTSEQRLAQSLQNHEWHDSLYRRRTDFSLTNEIRLFGHALMEKLVKPYKAITAHVWVIPVSQSFFSLAENTKKTEVDQLIKQHLVDHMLLMPSTPLPVLGVPGWWPAQDADFYADVKVFRPKKSSPL